MSDAYDLDYKAMFEALQEQMKALMKADEEYYSLITVITENAKYSTVLGENILRLPKLEQIKYMRIAAKMAFFAKRACEKYRLIDEESEEVTQ